MWKAAAVAACALGVSAVAALAQVGPVRHTGASALKECRETVGRPIVHACVRSKLQYAGGKRHHHLPACRDDARPAVRACVQRTVPHIVDHCVETVGRPMVRACVQSRLQREGGPRRQLVEVCRMSISWAVRACVARTVHVAPSEL